MLSPNHGCADLLLRAKERRLSGWHERVCTGIRTMILVRVGVGMGVGRPWWVGVRMGMGRRGIQIVRMLLLTGMGARVGTGVRARVRAMMGVRRVGVATVVRVGVHVMDVVRRRLVVVVVV